MYLIARWVMNALGLLLVAYLIPGIEVAGIGTALVVALVLGLVNALVRPVLFILTLPVTLLTLGLFIFVLNGFLFWLTATFIEGFEVTGAFAAIIGPIVLSFISWVASKFIQSLDEKKDI